MTKAEAERNSHYTKRINEIRAERDRLSSMLVTHKFADKERMQVNGWIAELNKKITELQKRIQEPVLDRLRGGGRTLMLDEELKTYEVPKFRYVFLKNGNVRETIDADSDAKAFSQISKFGYHISMFDGCIRYDKTCKNYTIITF